MEYVRLNLKNLRLKCVNWFAMVAGGLTILLTVSSMFVPWWQLTLGQTVANVRFSPISLSTNVLGYSIAIPIIAAINWILTILLLSAGVVLIIYSIFPAKPYSKTLLSFGYKKPLEMFIGFVALMLIMTNIGTILEVVLGPSTLSGADFNVPWIGSKTLQLPASLTQGVQSRIAVSAQLEWTFWLAAIVAALCVAARLYHK